MMNMNRLTNWIRRSKAQVLPKTTRNTISNKTTNKINMVTIIKTNHRTVKTLLLARNHTQIMRPINTKSQNKVRIRICQLLLAILVKTNLNKSNLKMYCQMKTKMMIKFNFDFN